MRGLAENTYLSMLTVNPENYKNNWIYEQTTKVKSFPEAEENSVLLPPGWLARRRFSRIKNHTQTPVIQVRYQKNMELKITLLMSKPGARNCRVIIADDRARFCIQWLTEASSNSDLLRSVFYKFDEYVGVGFDNAAELVSALCLGGHAYKFQ